jgi:hypothetical protein
MNPLETSATAQTSWKTFSGERLSNDILNDVEEAILRETKAGNRLKLCIGTDSQVKGAFTDYATVILFLRERAGGFMFIKEQRVKNLPTLKERLLKEVADSIETAYALCPILEKYKVELEVHADINTDPKFKSNTALREAMGYILGMGFVFKAKPDAYASSVCAGKVCTS